MTNQTVHKKNILESIEKEQGAFQKYKDFFIGRSGLIDFIKYEIAHIFAGPLPGSPGYVMRKLFMNSLLGYAGKGVNIGRNVSFRHPGKISIGKSTAIDDYCLLDAHGVSESEFNIGSNVLIARGTAISAKTDHGFVEIGDGCVIGKNCILSSSGGIKLGKWVGIAGSCYVGGGRYSTEADDIPIMKQDIYSQGPVVVGDDVWIGAGVTILDGVTIGKGSIVGAGSVVRENIPEYTAVTPHQRLVMLPRDMKKSKKTT